MASTAGSLSVQCSTVTCSVFYRGIADSHQEERGVKSKKKRPMQVKTEIYSWVKQRVRATGNVDKGSLVIRKQMGSERASQHPGQHPRIHQLLL